MPPSFLLSLFVPFLSFLLLSSVPSSCTAAECHSFDPQAAHLTSSFCSPFVSTQIALNSSSQTIADTKLQASELFSFIKNVTSILPLNCYKLLLGSVCQNSFPTCTESLSPIYPCQSLCQAALAACDPVVFTVGPIPMDCQSFEHTLNCTATSSPMASFALDPNPHVTECPSVYALRRKPDPDEAYCAIRCPTPEFTIDELKAYAHRALILASISLVLIVFLSISILIDVNKRKQFPIRLQLYLCISIALMTIGFMMGGTDPMKTTMCADQTTYSNQNNNSLCGAQGAIIMYFGFSSGLWALLLSLVLYLTVARHVQISFLKKYEGHMHVCGWGTGLVFLIIALRLEQFDYSHPARVNCFMHIDVTTKFSAELYLFYIPLTTFFIVVAVVLILVVIAIRRVELPPGPQRDAVRAQYRVLYFSAGIVLVLGTTCFFHFAQNSQVILQDYHKKYAWIACKVRAELFGQEYPAECNTETNPNRRASLNVTIMNISSQLIGILAFLGLGTRVDIFQHWYFLIKCVLKRDFEGAWRFIRFGPRPSAKSVRMADLADANSNSTSSTKNSGSGNSPFPRGFSSSSTLPSTLGKTSTDSSYERDSRMTFMSMASKAIDSGSLEEIEPVSSSNSNSRDSSSEEDDA